MHRSKVNIINRIEALDVLRGIALLAITCRHFFTRYNYEGAVYSSNTLLATLDQAIELADYQLFFGKSYTIFAFLFGVSVFLQQRSKAGAFDRYMVVRLLLLLVFAGLNALLFPSGDILALYAVVGFLILPVLKLPVKWILGIALFFLAQPLEWAQVATYLLEGGRSVPQARSALLMQDLHHTIATGSLSQILWTNSTKGLLSGFLWAIETGRFTQTIGLMLLGFYIGKTGWLLKLIGEGKNVLSYVYAPLFIAILCFGIDHLMLENSVLDQRLRLIFSNWIHLCVAFLYIILFVFVYDKIAGKNTKRIACYGRMSLSNYVTQSLIGGILFAPFGLDLARQLPATALLLIFIAFVLTQICFSGAWLSRRHYGPLESIWRRGALALSGMHYYHQPKIFRNQ